MFGWGKKARVIAAQEVEIDELRQWSDEQSKEIDSLHVGITSLNRRRIFLEGALRTIADMETPSANATVKRMAKVAREAL